MNFLLVREWAIAGKDGGKVFVGCSLLLGYIPAMREQIEKLLRAVPFEPLSVDVAADVAYSIPTPDHVLLGKNILVVEDDQGYVDLVNYRHIRRISHKAIPH